MECILTLSCFIRRKFCGERKVEIYQEIQECESELVLTAKYMPTYVVETEENGSKVILLTSKRKPRTVSQLQIVDTVCLTIPD